MATMTPAPPDVEPKTVADLIALLGDIPPHRVRLRPALGTATEADVVALWKRERRLAELVDGVLVEKAMGYKESMLALCLARLLMDWTLPRNLGLVTGPDGCLRLFPGLVRIPDVAFASWDRVPGRRVPDEPIPDLVPDLVIEVLSESNTPGEMARKCREYFEAGVRLVWLVDPATRNVAVHTGPAAFTVLDADATLDGGAVLPGFSFSLRALFAELDRQG